MIGIVLVVHGNLSQSLLDVVELISGPQKAFRALAISAADNIEMKRVDLMDVIDAVDEGDGVIVLTDLFGGTPSNFWGNTIKFSDFSARFKAHRSNRRC